MFVLRHLLFRSPSTDRIGKGAWSLHPLPTVTTKTLHYSQRGCFGKRHNGRYNADNNLNPDNNTSELHVIRTSDNKTFLQVPRNLPINCRKFIFVILSRFKVAAKKVILFQIRMSKNYRDQYDQY